MLLELALAAGAAYAADKTGLINLSGSPSSTATGKRPARSTAPVPSAQDPSRLVAPSIPGHVVPAPAPFDLKAKDANGGFSGTGVDQGVMAAASAMFQGATGQGAPYVDQEGYWRDFSTGALYQFRDPNTNAPIGRPGYMPLRYQAFAQAQDATEAAQAAAAGATSDDTAAVAGQVLQTGVQIATTAATVAGAVAGGGSAAGTAAAVAGVAGSVLACLGPLPIAPIEGWSDAHVKMLRAYDGDRSLQVAVTESPAERGKLIVLAVEVAADAAMLLEDDVERATAALYADHAHEVVGVFPSLVEAVTMAERYELAWRARRELARNKRHETTHANACACEGIEAR